MIRIIFVSFLLCGCAVNWPSFQESGIEIGMSDTAVIEKIGSPNDVNTQTTKDGIYRQYIYYYYNKWSGYNRNIVRYIYFQNGKVFSWQE